ncbi:aminodeoxychorismate lyase [Enterobacteriaceae bacterium LUAb1]
MYWVNGKKQTMISAGDRGLQFGDGNFTTARVTQGKIAHLSAHLLRLQSACERLLMPEIDFCVLEQEMCAVAEQQQQGVLKVILTRGNGGRGYSFQGCRQVTRILSCSPYPAHYTAWLEKGLCLMPAPIRLSRNPLLAGIKHLNRLEQIMIRASLEQSDADEALVLDTDGWLVECCAANVFWRKGQQVLTPDLSQAGVRGIMRDHILTQLTLLGYQTDIVQARPDVLADADEVFICNALMPVLPVTRINQWRYTSRKLCDQLRTCC